MAKLSIFAGSTGVSWDIFIQASTATDGSGLSGLLGTSAGLQCFYHRPFSTSVPVSLTTGSLTQAYTTGVFVEINSTGMKGMYRFDPPDTALAAGAKSVSFMLSGATAMAQVPLEVELTAWNNQDGVAGGLIGLSSTGTLGSVSNVRGTATVILASGVHTGAIIPIVQTASNDLSAVVTSHTTAALAQFFNVDAGTFSTASANSVVRQITTNVSAAGGAPSVAQITTGVWAAFGTGIVQLNTGTHTGAVIPTVNIVQTSADGRMANLDATVSSRASAVQVGTTTSYPDLSQGEDAILTALGFVAVVGSPMTLTTGERTAVADRFLDRDMSVGVDSGSPTVRTPRQALRFLRNKWTLATGTLTVYREDDSTPTWTAVIASTSSADAIVGSDPA